MNIRITDLKNFIQTSDCVTIMQASQKLEISQPALSESLKRLESDLGYTLFYRSRSGIKLTPSGKVFLTKAQVAIESLKNLNVVQNQNEVFAGQKIIIGCHATVATYFITDTLKKLKSLAPDYNIELEHDLSRNIQAKIQRGDIDIGIVINPSLVPDLVIQKITKDQVGVWQGHNLKSQKNNSNSTAEERSHELDTIICNLDLFQTQSILKKWKNHPKKIISTSSLELICQMTSQNIGYGIIPERAVKMSPYNLKHVTNLPTYQDEVAIVYRPEYGKTQAEKILLDCLKKSIK